MTLKELASVCLGRLITQLISVVTITAEITLMDFSKWLIREAYGVRDGKKTTKGVVSVQLLEL